jgi:uncharacterized membrane protein
VSRFIFVCNGSAAPMEMLRFAFADRTKKGHSMAHAHKATIVPRPIAEVFAFLADGVNNPKWRPEVTDIRLVSGPVERAQYSQSMKGPGGRTVQGDYRITRYEAPRRLDFEVVAGPARPVGSFVLKELTADSTEVVFTLDLKPRGMMILMTPVINRQVDTEVENIGNLTTAMEG